MKIKTKKLFYNIYKNVEKITDVEIINFLKENNEYDENYYDLLKDELLLFLELNTEKRVEEENNKEELKKEKDLYCVYNILKEDTEFTSFVKQNIKERVKIKKENIKDIINSFTHKKRNIDNYNSIDLYDLFDFSFFFYCKNIEYINCSKKNDKYRIFIKKDNDIVFLSIFDIVCILYDKENFKQAIEYLNEIFNWEKFSELYKKEIINKNNNNAKYLNENKDDYYINKYYDILNILLTFENNSFSELNRTKTGEHYFFISKNKLSELSKKPPTTVNNYINFLTLLGFIEKVNYNDISLESDIRINKNNRFNKVNILKINDFYKIDKEIKENISYVNKNKIKDKDLRIKNLEEKNKIELLDKIYPNR